MLLYVQPTVKPGKGKGKGKGATLNLPAKAKSSTGKPMHAEWSQGICTFGVGCRFTHICYFYDRPEHAGKDHA